MVDKNKKITKEKNMEITLNDAEFVEAVTCYLEHKGFKTNAYDIDVRVVQGRNGAGNRAEVTLEDSRLAGFNPTVPFNMDADVDILKAPESVEPEKVVAKEEEPSTINEAPFGKLFPKNNSEVA